jgi:hypothetical protein
LSFILSEESYLFTDDIQFQSRLNQPRIGQSVVRGYFGPGKT